MLCRKKRSHGKSYFLFLQSRERYRSNGGVYAPTGVWGGKMKTYTEITPERGYFRIGFRDLWQYRDLVLLLAKKSFSLTYKQTVLGPVWLLIVPLLSSGVYSVVFGDIAGIQTDGVPKLLFFLCTNCLWTLFSSCISENANVFRSNANVFGKVYFPRLAVPVSNVLVRLVLFCVQLLLILCFTVYYVIKGTVSPLWWAWPLIPLLLAYISVFGMCVGLIASSMTTKYRDLSILISLGVHLWMFVTPVVYPVSQVKPGVLRFLVSVNPVTAPVETFRLILLGRGNVDVLSVCCSLCAFAVCVLGGIAVFHRVERSFIDTV